MSKLARNIKNITRNFVFSSGLKEISIVKNTINKRRENIDIERGKVFKEFAGETLKKIKDILDQEDIIFWLDFGTLLGAVREKDFIEHDIDIDFGIMYEVSMVKKLEEAFEKNEIRKCREFTLDDKIVEQTYEYKGLAFDIFYYFTDESKKWCYGFTFGNNALQKKIYDNRDVSTGLEGVRYISPKAGVEKIMFKNNEYFVPENTHEYLKLNYGENYMTPNKDWDSVEDPKNQEKLESSLKIKMIEYFY